MLRRIMWYNANNWTFLSYSSVRLGLCFCQINHCRSAPSARIHWANAICFSLHTRSGHVLQYTHVNLIHTPQDPDAALMYICHIARGAIILLLLLLLSLLSLMQYNEYYVTFSDFS